MITQENFVRLRTHHNNIQRYRELLETSLTVFERQYIERQLSEEQLAIETLAAEILGVDGSICRPTRLSQDFRAKRDSKLTRLTAWIASFVRVPCR